MANSSVRFATLNLWHALAAKSKLRFEYLEPDTRREIRHRRQIEVLRSLKADALFLQEVNPVWERSLELAEELELVAVEQTDLAGVKVLGLGFPLNLNSGLLTLVKESWSPRWVESLQLSGHKGARARTFYSFQLDECRYALLVEVLHPQLGRMLLVNVHLHHGLEWKESYRPAIEDWIENYEISDSVAEELFKRLSSANHRRNEEVDRLLEKLKSLRSRYNHIVLAGDLNFSPESQTFSKLRDFGFAESDREFNTWDPQKNQANHHFQARFPVSVFIEDLTFSPTAQAELTRLIRGWENEVRQLDYILITPSNAFLGECRLFGEPEGDTLALSDHFGLLYEGKSS